MKLFRVWLLVLLAATLPIRGATAAAMLCPPASVGAQSETHRMGHGGVDHVGDVGVVGAHAQHQHDDGTSPDHGTSHQDKCNLCAAFCSLTPLVSEIPGIHEPRDLGHAPFPGFSAPAPTAESGRQDRPPRSI